MRDTPCDLPGKLLNHGDEGKLDLYPRNKNTIVHLLNALFKRPIPNY